MPERSMRRIAVSAVPTTLAAAAVAAPALAFANLSFAAMGLVLFFSPVCHQDPGRSLWLFGAPMAVCARCMGLYLGAAAGAWLRAPRSTLLPMVGAALAVNLIDVFTEFIGLHGNWVATRLIFGLLLGGLVGALVADWTARYSER